MSEFYVVLSVIGMFLIRIGIPFVLLIILGTLIERHQMKQRQENASQLQPVVDELAAEHQKAA